MVFCVTLFTFYIKMKTKSISRSIVYFQLELHDLGQNEITIILINIEITINYHDYLLILTGTNLLSHPYCLIMCMKIK